jgi:hypothetical protein
MTAKNISLFESKMLAVDGKQLFDQNWCFLQLKQDSDNIIYS